jgi:hypothetical protein
MVNEGLADNISIRPAIELIISIAPSVNFEISYYTSIHLADKIKKLAGHKSILTTHQYFTDLS